MIESASPTLHGCAHLAENIHKFWATPFADFVRMKEFEALLTIEFGMVISNLRSSYRQK